LGHSRGGFSTKLHAIVDTKARPLHVTLTPGERHELVAAVELLDHARGRALVGDTGYDSNEFRAEVRAREIKPVIHSKPERKRALPLDRKLYGLRYLVELFFHKLKRFRAVATRYDKTRRSYLALLQVVCIMLWLG
jgi:transposase